MKWENIHLESTLVNGESDNAVLIKMPSISNYKGFSFWHPKKCCRLVGKNGFLVQISFTEQFEFKLKKYGKGKFNFKQILVEKTLGVEEFKKELGFNNDILEDLKED